MFYVLLLRQEAERYRDMARQAADPQAEEECKDLAETIDEIATEVEEKISAG